VGKQNPNKYFLYRKRFILGYLFLAVSFLSLLFFLPQVSPNGLSNSEIDSAITSHQLNYQSIFSGNFIDLPYHLLQKASFKLFGITNFSIKLPSIIIGGMLGLLFVLLLNRWFKNNTAIIASIITVLSSSFLFIAGNGTPLIMIVFWPTLLLWLGAKTQGKERPAPIWCFIFAFTLFLSSFTPYMIYLIIAILIYTILQPHLRFTIKSLPPLPLSIVSILILSGFSLMGFILFMHPDLMQTMILSKNFTEAQYYENLRQAFLPFFTWNGVIESIFLAPQISLPAFLIAIVGLISTFKGFFASRNSIAIFFIFFTVVISGLRTDYAILLILPAAILIAHGLRYIVNKWHELFPENPYAKLLGVLPIALFLFIMITSDLSHFISGYRYTTSVANQFNNDLSLVLRHLSDGDQVLIDDNYNFSQLIFAVGQTTPLLQSPLSIKVSSQIKDFTPNTVFYSLHKLDPSQLSANPSHKITLTQIITSSKSQNADRLYQYLIE